MLLIDSLYINNSGGLVLLKYLIDKIEQKGIPTFYLLDKRCGDLFDFVPSNRKCIMKASMPNRTIWYILNKNKYNKVLCFGNIPPAIPFYHAVCYTYFHNINLLRIPKQESLKVRLLSWLKRYIYIILKRNTDYWIVQTSNTQVELVKHLRETNSRVLTIPFFNINGAYKENSVRTGYIYASNYTPEKNFEFIVETWKRMAMKNITPILHLTLGNAPKSMTDKIQDAINYGAKIINHGSVSQEVLFSLYRGSKAIVYAAVNESLGLCLIEAMENGCDVIGPNLPYISAICTPSASFSIGNIDSLMKAISDYEYTSVKSEIKVENQIDEMIKLLTAACDKK